MSYKDLATKVMAIAQEAGEAILEIYQQAEGVVIEKKADNSPLTIADKTANDIICKGLEQLVDKHPIISEENKAIPYETRKDYPYCWLVDPLDGTKEFIKRNGEFTVNIALIHQERIVFGVVFAPVLGEMYWAAKGEGAFLIKDGETTKLKVDTFSKTDKQLNLVCSRSHLNDDTQQFVDQFSEPNLVATGSSLKFLILAKGEAHIYPRLAPTMEWDTGAAQIILEEAGGSVLQNGKTTPLMYNKENLLNPFFVAAGKMT
mgnify:CR=1 FL=1